MNSTEMMERFRRFVQADLSLATPNRMRQVSEVLLKTSTIRIIMTRDEHRTEDLDIDIEVSLPSLPETSDVSAMQKSIDSVIVTLEYLRRLISMDFNLEMLQDEGLLIASATLGKDTREDVFKALKPPD
jgi:hypothetical protein